MTGPGSTKELPNHLRPALVPFLLLLVVSLLSWSEAFRGASEEQLDEAAARAIAAFAVARTINAVVSVIQETEIGVSLGINTTLAPGQILDPLNDLIERFSLAALTAATLLWSLKLLGAIVLPPWLPMVLLGLLLLYLPLASRGVTQTLAMLLLRLVRAGLVVWVFAAATPWLIAAVHDSDAVQSRYVEATEALEQAGDRLRGLVAIESPWEMDRQAIGETTKTLTGMADDLSRQAIVVLAVFVFEVLLVPLGIFWIASRAVAPVSATGT
jgi:hypothetical protein